MFQPVPCMQCENAPCEQVCPVAATVHTADGLNAMVYNRCIGTRYCSNNCPYKVRRFNFFNFTKDTPELLKLAANPGRHRALARRDGEVHLLRAAHPARRKIDAKMAERPLADGDVKTACQQTCPTQAIVFGDIRDPASRGRRAQGAQPQLRPARRARQQAAHELPGAHPQPASRPGARPDGAARRDRAWPSAACCSSLGARRRAACAAAPRAGRRSTSTRTWTTSRGTSRRRRAPSSTTARRCARRSRAPWPAASCATTGRSGPGKDAAGAFVAPSSRRRSTTRCSRAAPQRYDIYCAACHDKRGDGKGILFERGKVPTPIVPQRPPAPDARRPDLRHHHQRLRADARLPLSDPGRRPLGDHRPRARAAGSARVGAPREPRSARHRHREAAP